MMPKQVFEVSPSSVATREFSGGTRGRSEPLPIVDWVLVFGLCLLLMFGVLAFGGVEEWAMFLFEAGATVLFLMWAAKQLLSRQVKLPPNPLYLPALLFFLLICAQIAFNASAYPYVTRYGALEYVSYGIVMLIASESLRTKQARKAFALVMIGFGALYAFFALAQDLTANNKIFWIRTVRFSGGIYGSYVNRNHYAGLMEMLVPIPLVLSMSHLLRGVKRMLVGFCGILMAGTIFLCGSRGGMVAFVLEMVLLGTLMFAKKRRLHAILGYAALCISTLAFIFLSNNGRGLARIGDLDPGIRPQIIKDSLRMFTHRPIWGWGLGTFPTVYPEYRSFYTNQFVNEAHNDYAQLLVETGVLGFVLMLWFLAQMYRASLPVLHGWQYRWDRAVSLAASIGCTGILVHSFVEFNLQIPANAAFFYVLCALAASEHEAGKRADDPHTSRFAEHVAI
jgi:O-antigen ligase